MQATSALPTWLLWAQALSGPALAIVGAIIACRQVRIARVKLQHDLYERRIKVYLGISEFIADFSILGEASPERFKLFYAATREARFLFPRTIHDFILEIERKGTQLDSILRRIKTEPARAELLKLLDREGEHKAWLHSQQQKLGKIFEPYLRIGPT